MHFVKYLDCNINELKHCIFQLKSVCTLVVYSPLSSQDALKHHLSSLKTVLISLQPRLLERKFS